MQQLQGVFIWLKLQTEYIKPLIAYFITLIE